MIYPMYFQPLSPQQANPLGFGIQQGTDIVNNILAARARSLQNQQMQAQLPYAGQMAQADLQTKLLANALSQNTLNYAPQMSAADLAVKQAQPGLENAQANEYNSEAAKNNFFVNNPLLMMPGIGGQLGAYYYLMQNMPKGAGNTTNVPGANIPATNIPVNNPASSSAPPVNLFPTNLNTAPPSSNSVPFSPAIFRASPSNAGNAFPAVQSTPYFNTANNNQLPNANNPLSNLPNMILQGATSGIQKNIAQADYFTKRAQGYNFQAMPSDQRDAVLAQASGMGYDPQQATQLLMNGYSISDLARAKGFDPGNLPDPIYPTTKASLNLIQRRNQALNEINTLNPIFTAAIAPYAQRINGLSPVQVAQAIRGDDPDAQAKLLAAKALMPEMSSLRIKAMGGNVGIEAIREVTNASMGNLKTYQPLVSPAIYSRANQYIDNWIQQGAGAANRVGLQSYNFNSTPQNQIGVNQVNAAPLNIPKFNNQQEGINWYNSLPPQQQAQVRAQLGGQ